MAKSKSTKTKATAPEKEVEAPSVEKKAPTAPKVITRADALSDVRNGIIMLIETCDKHASQKILRVSDLKKLLKKRLPKLI